MYSKFWACFKNTIKLRFINGRILKGEILVKIITTRKKIAIFIIIFLVLQTSISVLSSAQIVNAEEDFQFNVEHKNNLENICYREFETELTFSKKQEPYKLPVDIVFVQDASGSFKETIPVVKDGLKRIANSLESEDRVQLTTYNGHRTVRTADGSLFTPWRNDYVQVETRQTITRNKLAFNRQVDLFRVDGGTPTALGLRESLNNYNRNKGNTTDRETIFVLITDGVANVRLDGAIHQLHTSRQSSNNGYGYNPRRNDIAVRGSVEYNQDYRSAIREVENIAAQIKQTYNPLIVGFWEDLSVFTGNANQADRYVGPLRYREDAQRGYPMRPHVIESLKRTASTPDMYVEGQNNQGTHAIVPFVEEIAKKIEGSRNVVKPEFLIELNIDEKYVLDKSSVKLISNTGYQTEPTINGNKITYDLKGAPKGEYKVVYNAQEKEPVFEEHVAGTGQAKVDGKLVKLPDVIHDKNEVCETIPKVKKTIGKVDGDPKQSHELKKRDEIFEYKSEYTFKHIPSTVNTVEVLDELDQALEVIEARLVNSKNEEVLKPQVEENKVFAQIEKKDSTYAYLYDEKYTLVIKAKIRSDISLDELKEYSEGIPNTSKLKIDNDPTESNTVHVIPPKEMPKVEKEVSQPKLTTLDEEFTWTIKYTFGSDLSNVTQIVLVDKLEDILELQELSLEINKVDALSLGDLKVDNNKVLFTFFEKDGSYRYLENKEAIMTLKTKLKSNLNDHILSAYLKEGIPNEASLNLTEKNEIKKVSSNRPTIELPELSNVRLIKIDADTKEGLEGAEFSVLNSRDEKVANLITNKEGIAEVSMLPLGKYKIEETKAPVGYKLLTKPKVITLDKSGELLELEVENKKLGWSLPETGGTGPIIYGLIGLAGILCATLLYLRRKYI